MCSISYYDNLKRGFERRISALKPNSFHNRIEELLHNTT